MHDHAEMLMENGYEKNVYVDFVSQSEVMIKNGSIDITRNSYVCYGLRKKVPIKNDSAENNEKRVS